MLWAGSLPDFKAHGAAVNHFWKDSASPAVRRISAASVFATGAAFTWVVAPAAGAEDPLMCQGKAPTIASTAPGESLFGTPGDDVILGSDSAENIDARQGGNDTICALSGDDVISTGDGDDHVWAGPGNDSVSVGLGANRVSGGAGNDAIGSDGDLLAPDTGDIINGNGGEDSLSANVANDTFRGGPGNDQVVSNGGNDQLYGGADDDRLFFDAGFGNPVIGAPLVLGQGGDDRIFDQSDHVNVGRLWGGPGADWIRAINAGPVRSVGGDGADHLEGGSHDDTLYGGDGADLVEGYPGDDTLYGGADNDTLYGGDGEDTLYGGAGTDIETQ